MTSTKGRRPGTTASADVIVIGAGFAGLAAARCLVDAGCTTVLLEAADRIGGRTDSEALAPGLDVDLGAGYASRHDRELLGLAEEFSVQSIPLRHADGNGVTLGSSGQCFERATGEYAAGTLQLIADIEGLASSVDLSAPWAAPDAPRLDAVPFAGWLRAHTSEATIEEIARPIRAFMGELDDFSMLHLLFYSKSNGGVSTFLGIAEAHDALEFPRSLHSITAGYVARLGDRIHLQQPVTRIRSMASEVLVDTTKATFRAERCIVACPPQAARSIEFDPCLDDDRMALLAGMPMVPVIKTQILYREPFWRSCGLSGTGTTPLIETLDSSPRDGSLGVLTVFTDRPADARRMSALPRGARREVVLSEVAALWGADALHPLEYIERDWGAEPFSKGCIMYMPPGAWTSTGWVIRRPSGFVHWAGTETAVECCGNVEGAIRSGRRAADEVIVALGS